MLKKLFASKKIVIGIALLSVFSLGVCADSIYKDITVAYRSLKVVVNNQRVLFGYDSAGNAIEPFIYNGTTYLPVRSVAQALDKNVSWDGATGTIFIDDNDVSAAVTNYVSNNGTPNETIDKLANSLNAANLDMLFECFEPQFADYLKGSYELGNAVSEIMLGVEINSKDILKILPMFSGLQLGDDFQFIWPTWYADNYLIEYSADKQIAYLACDLYVDMGNGQVDAFQGYFELTNLNGNWLIYDMR